MKEGETLLNKILNLFKDTEVSGTVLTTKDLGPGRYIEERDLEVFVRKGNDEQHLLYLKVFNGRPPYYRPWIEVFGINPDVEFFGTFIEDTVFKKLSEALGPGESIFIEYGLDHETRSALQRGQPPEKTRLGSKLLQLGFRWFKDWYFPEGAMEGGQKLQAQK